MNNCTHFNCNYVKENHKYENLINSIAILIDNKDMDIKEVYSLINNFFEHIEMGKQFDWDKLDKRTDKFVF